MTAELQIRQDGINNMQGIFIRTRPSHRRDIVSDLYMLSYIGHEHDKKNLGEDVSRIFSDLRLSAEEAKKKHINRF
jgi:hypothetical protein